MTSYLGQHVEGHTWADCVFSELLPVYILSFHKVKLNLKSSRRCKGQWSRYIMEPAPPCLPAAATSAYYTVIVSLSAGQFRVNLGHFIDSLVTSVSRNHKVVIFKTIIQVAHNYSNLSKMHKTHTKIYLHRVLRLIIAIRIYTSN